MRSLNDALIRFDPKLIARRGDKGLVTVFRKVKRYDSFRWSEGILTYVKEVEVPVIYLTENWNRSGRIVERGILNVLSRLQEIDSWNRVRLFEDLQKANEKADKSIERSKQEDLKDHLSEKRDQFVRATSDINLGIVNKK